MAGEPGGIVAAARGVTKSYQTGDTVTTVLDGIDLQVGAGQFLSVMGPSGSGKSTLLHLLGGLDTPDSGEVTIGNTLLSAASDDERTRLRRDQIGIVYQFFNLIPVLTVEENVALPAVIAGARADDYVDRRDALIELVGLAGHRHKQPQALSGGQQQRVAIARALFIEPTVLLADEPTGNLDLRAGAEILEVFLRVRDELGQTIVMVTHDPRSAAHGDRVLLLRDGRIVDCLDVGAAARGQQRRQRPLRAGDHAGMNGHRRPAPVDPTDPARGVAVLRWLERLDAAGAVKRTAQRPAPIG